MAKVKFKLSGQLAIGSVVMVAVVLSAAIYGTQILDKSVEVSNEITATIQPSIDALRLMRTQLEKSESLVNAWVNEPNEEKQAELTAMHEGGFEMIRERTDSLVSEWTNIEQQDSVTALFRVYDDALNKQREIMKSLQTFEDYMENMASVVEIHESLITQCRAVKAELRAFEALKEQEIVLAKNEMVEGFSTLKMLLSVLMITVVGVGIVLYLMVNRMVARPITRLTKVIANLSVGHLPERDYAVKRGDEIGEISRSCNDLVNGLRKVSAFASAIGDGDFEAEFDPLSDDDELGKALLTMRENLMRAKSLEHAQSFINEGVAKFSNMLRVQATDEREFYPKLAGALCKFLNCQMGGIYLIRRPDTEGDVVRERDSEYIELVGTYAFPAGKQGTNIFSEGEGLVGQCWREQREIYITNLPKNYVSISSGLGDGTPAVLLLVPLITNDEVQGVIELAAFKEFDETTLKFMTRLSEIIASSIITIQNNFRTESLLNVSKELTQQLREQEEELMQQASELQASQEEMQRNNKLLKQKMEAIQRVVGHVDFDAYGELVNKEELLSRMQGGAA